MRCPFCGHPELNQGRQTFEHASNDGRTLRMEVDGMACPNCGEVLIVGPDAERISASWYSVSTSETPRLPFADDQTAIPPLFARSTQWMTPVQA